MVEVPLALSSVEDPLAKFTLTHSTIRLSETTRKEITRKSSPLKHPSKIQQNPNFSGFGKLSLEIPVANFRRGLTAEIQYYSDKAYFRYIAKLAIFSLNFPELFIRLLFKPSDCMVLTSVLIQRTSEEIS